MANANHVVPPAAKLMDMICGHWIVAVIYSAAKLSLADRLAAGPRTSDDLAADLARVQALGGQLIAQQVVELPGVGRCAVASVFGPDGEQLELFQPQ